MPASVEAATATVNMRERVVGVDRLVPLLDGRRVTYVNLDNAASTPPLVDVMDAVNRFAPYYASVHRGTGFKSRLSTEAYEWARHVVGRFVGADLDRNTVVFGKNTTEAINKLSFRLPLGEGSVVVSTQMEHHSNDLPWRVRSQVVHVRTKPDGRLDEAHFDALLAEHAGRIALVTVTGASNVTGYLLPVYRLARKAHEAGARILVDAAQMAPHRRVNMLSDDDPEHLDFVSIAAHKMYAPFGTGALVGPKETFRHSAPEYSGGGTVAAVTLDEVYWAEPPEREEAGSPNVIGAVAMATAAEVLMDVGMHTIADHEKQLLGYALEQMATIPGLTVYGEGDPEIAVSEKVGVVPFNLAGTPHALVAAVLGYEWGIGVRNGCFCAHPYVVSLLDLNGSEAGHWRARVLEGDRSELPGMVRMSLGCYSSSQDVDRLIEGLSAIARGRIEGDYRVDTATGEYLPSGFVEPLAEYLPWLGAE